MRKKLKKLFFRKKKEEEFVEVPFEEETDRVDIRIENFEGLIDVDRITKLVKKGSIVFLKTKNIQKRDLGQFQAGVTKLKKICDSYGWDIVGTEEGYILITPRFVKIAR